ncbi:hypothetical protein RVR_2970 [Actinacidiphila reveromycinica]|uniref:NAD(P)-binding domain-containing protein n=1 Tax=Actinacidiphila reveromycinica TaxID=659352 RepID=A0A7U3URB5_9ACTN|nr:NAD(P)H-binding protein [Streptomyces sp. SN-593]BBA97298.1 hypothetical protein RVR_2970 [Streptomyces sp. SN-593]
MIVVTGATGNIGRPLVAALVAAGEQVRAVSRNPVTDELPDSVDHLAADLAEPGSMSRAVDGADALFLLVAGELANGSGDPARVLRAAEAGGVRRVVLVSSQIVGTRPDGTSHAGLRAFEAAVRACGLPWTILRPSGLASNAYGWIDGVRASRTVAAPFGDVALPVVDPADVSAVAAAALREDGHAGRTYEVTGPAPISPREQAVALGAAIGTELRFVELTREQARSEMARFMPADVADGTLALLGDPLPSERRVSPDAERVLGRAPGDFAGWAARHAAPFGARTAG